MTYRLPSPRVEDAETLPPGPTKQCPACKTKRLTYSDGDHNPTSKLAKPRACCADKRVSLGWFSKCQVGGAHLHESCENCGHEWLSAFGGAP
jgi:hypothetical protein